MKHKLTRFSKCSLHDVFWLHLWCCFQNIEIITIAFWVKNTEYFETTRHTSMGYYYLLCITFMSIHSFYKYLFSTYYTSKTMIEARTQKEMEGKSNFATIHSPIISRNSFQDYRVFGLWLVCLFSHIIQRKFQLHVWMVNLGGLLAES